ncbi:MAG: ATP-binding protein [Kiritimatiellae bacterium]|nr:ATP-binding protein [Kiritimatiellia bacterium]
MTEALATTRISDTVAAKLDPAKIAAYPIPEESKALILSYADRITSDPACDWSAVEAETGYSSSVMSRVFRGEYAGNIANVVTALRRYFDRKRHAVARASYVPNAITRRIHTTIAFEAANNEDIALIVGPSRIGKTAAAEAWVEANGERGSAVLVTCPPIGGTSELMRRICVAAGMRAATSLSASQMLAKIHGFFSPSRTLILDEAQRMVPAERRSSPRLIELVRDLHDAVKCPVVLIATARLEDQLAMSAYVHEQLIGRILAPLRISGDLAAADWQPIARQMVPDIGPAALEALGGPAVVQSPQRLAALVHVLSIARRAAEKAGRAPNDDDVLAAIKWRRANFAASVLATPVRRPLLRAAK